MCSAPMGRATLRKKGSFRWFGGATTQSPLRLPPRRCDGDDQARQWWQRSVGLVPSPGCISRRLVSGPRLSWWRKVFSASPSPMLTSLVVYASARTPGSRLSRCLTISLDPPHPGTPRSLEAICPEGGCPPRVSPAYHCHQSVTFLGGRNVNDSIPRERRRQRPCCARPDEQHDLDQERSDRSVRKRFADPTFRSWCC